ncbi:MAG: AAA family ATPase, partial [Planctomycetaceae bacterium]|nr:AAA family ATPase [Planctomycetaceae bacterium]
QESVVTLRARLEGIRERILQQARDNSQTAADVGAHRSRLEAAQRRSLDLNHQLERMTGQLSQLCLALEACRQDLNDCQAELLSRQNLADQILHSRDGLVVEQTSSRQSLSELREHRSAMLARRAVLEDLEDRQEGFGIGVREILRRAEEAGSEPWDQICGSVADLLDVDMDNAALLEVALSGRAQLLVVRNLRPLLEYLNTGRCRINGRVGFVSLEQAQRHAGDPGSVSGSQYSADARRRGADDLALNPGTMPADDDFSTSWWSTPVMSTAHDMDLSSGLDDPLAMPGETLQPPGLEVTWVDPRTESPVVRSVFMQGPDVPTSLFGQTGVVGRADGLARSPRTMPWLASSLLADTWVVQTLDDAMRLHLASKGRFRFVTLQGELIEADGTLYAGTLRNESAVLSRKSEMRRLRNELTRLDHEIAQRELNITTLTDNIQTADTELESARRTVHEASNRVRQAESRIVDREHSITETETQQQTLLTQQTQLEQELDELQQHIDGAETIHLAGEQQVQRLQQQLTDGERELAQHQRDLENLERERNAAHVELTRSEERLAGLREAMERIQDDIQQRTLQQQEAERRLRSAAERRREILIDRLNAAAETAELQVAEDHLTDQIRIQGEQRSVLRQRRNEATRQEAEIREACRRQESAHHEYELEIRGIDHQLQTAADRIRDEFQLEVTEAVDAGRSAVAVWLSHGSGRSRKMETTVDDDADSPELGSGEPQEPESVASDSFSSELTLTDEVRAIISDDEQYPAIRSEIEQRVERLRRQLKKIGNVSSESLDNLTELETRYERLHSQLTDLEAARDTLREMVRRINVESRRMFLETFECIRGHFRELFRRLFGGGEADLILEDPEDVLECAIDVVARPPGKELRSLSLLSGGEKTMTAVGLLLSIFRSRPSPFCILDEVDAALDDANIGRFVNVLRDFQQSTQFIMITHRKPTMAVTDVLYGVTMEESGVSRRLSLRFDDVDENGHFKPRRDAVDRAA